MTHETTTGPHRGFTGAAEWSEDDGAFHGEVVGIRDVVTFTADTRAGLDAAFRASVDDYLEMLAEGGDAGG